MIIKDLNQSHIDEILKIEEVNYIEPWDYKIFVDEIVNSPNSEYFGLFDNDDNIIAYLGFWKLPDYLDITNVSVDPDYKRQGIATILLNELERRALDYETPSIFLEVNVNNLAAINLYKKHGYKELKRIKNYYSRLRQDAYLMQKEINNE